VTSVNLTATPSEKRSPEKNSRELSRNLRQPEAQHPLQTTPRPTRRIGTPVLTSPSPGGKNHLTHKTGRGRPASATACPVSFVPMNHPSLPPTACSLQTPVCSPPCPEKTKQNQRNKLTRLIAEIAFLAAAGTPGRRERLPARAPLRTVHESFPSHGSSQTKAPPDIEDPQPNGLLGNTELWPCWAGLQGATAPGRTERRASLVICFSRLRRFHMRSCQVRPDRRGPIPRITRGLWLFRSSPCCVCSACLTVGPATTRVAQNGNFFMFCIRYRKR
jgi:hypothetical protein